MAAGRASIKRHSCGDNEMAKGPVERGSIWVPPPQKAASMPPGWSRHYTETGDPYYYNEAEGRTSWTEPTPLPPPPSRPPPPPPPNARPFTTNKL